MANHPTYMLDQIIEHLTTSWGNNDTNTQTWHGAGHQLTIAGPAGYPTPRAGSNDQITYALDVAPSSGHSFEAPGIKHMNVVQTSYAQLAFQLWDDLVPFRLVQNSGSNASDADITLNLSVTTDIDKVSGARQTYTHSDLAASSNGDEGIIHKNIWLAASWSEFAGGLVLGGYGLSLVEHEIGHALG